MAVKPTDFIQAWFGQFAEFIDAFHLRMPLHFSPFGGMLTGGPVDPHAVVGVHAEGGWHLGFS